MLFKRGLPPLFGLALALVLTLLSALSLSFLLPTAADAQALVAVPALTGHVNDQAGMLNAGDRAKLEQTLSAYETQTGSQIAVLTIDSTAPEAIEQYGIRVADAWKIGRAKVDDGVILIVAKNNSQALRRLRIEAGRGVQGSLTDAQSKRVLEDVIAPYFRQNDYYGGLNAGVAAISALLNNEQLPAPAKTAAPAANDQGDWLGGLLPIILFGVFLIVTRLRSRGGPGGLGSNRWGGAAGVVIGSLLSQSGRGGGYGGGGGFGGGGGGFSGGGGGFDGGGASGNW